MGSTGVRDHDMVLVTNGDQWSKFWPFFFKYMVTYGSMECHPRESRQAAIFKFSSSAVSIWIKMPDFFFFLLGVPICCPVWLFLNLLPYKYFSGPAARESVG